MARCPGSGKRCVPQLLRRFKGLRGDARGEAWEGRSGRMLAATMGRSQTAPGMQGSGRADGKLTLVFLAWQWPCWDGRWKTAIAGTGTAAGWDGSITIFGRIEFRTALCSTLLYSTWHTLATGLPHAFLAEDQAHSGVAQQRQGQQGAGVWGLLTGLARPGDSRNRNSQGNRDSEGHVRHDGIMACMAHQSWHAADSVAHRCRISTAWAWQEGKT